MKRIYTIEDIIPGDIVSFLEIAPTHVYRSPSHNNFDDFLISLPGYKQILTVIATGLTKNGCLNCFVISSCGIVGWIRVVDKEIVHIARS